MTVRGALVWLVCAATACSAGGTDPIFFMPPASGLGASGSGGDAGSSDDPGGAGGLGGDGGDGGGQASGGSASPGGSSASGGTGDPQGIGGADAAGGAESAGGTGDAQGGGTDGVGVLSSTGPCLTVSYSESDDGGQFGPRNVGAIWLSDANGAFLRTLDVWANKRAPYLSAWLAASKGSKVDAVSSATSSSLGTKTTTWDCKDLSGHVVAAGSYVVHAEFTEDDGSGPITSMSFELAPGAPFDTQLGDDGYFMSRHLVHPP